MSTLKKNYDVFAYYGKHNPNNKIKNKINLYVYIMVDWKFFARK